MNGLALCAGVGGLELGVSLALGGRYRCLGYVERDTFTASVLVARMEDQALDRAPIWDDLETFPSLLYSGSVDLVTAGIPCTPHSSAGKRLGEADERNLWPLTRKLLRDVAPAFFFLENSAGLVAGNAPYLRRIAGELSEDGWDAEWTTLRAKEVGAPHERDRVFLLAYRVGCGFKGFTASRAGSGKSSGGNAHRCGTRLPHAAGSRREGAARKTHEAGKGSISGCSELPHTELSPGREQHGQQCDGGTDEPGGRGEFDLFPPTRDDDEGWRQALGERPELEPAIRRVAYGMADRVDRLRAIGNGVVPLQAAVAFSVLADRLRLGHVS